MSRISRARLLLVAVFATIPSSLPAAAFEAPDLFRRAETYRQELIAEGHQRLVSPLYTIVFVLIGMAALLAGEFNRRGQTLRVLAGGGSVYGTAAQVLSLSAGTATAAVEALTGNGDIARTNDRLGVVDPLFADWITRRFPV